MRAQVADVEICKDILRVVLEGAPELQARTPLDALAELRANHDAFRRFLLEPPHGHADVNACLLLPAMEVGAQNCLVVAAQFGYAPVAGTMVMAACAALSETKEIAHDTGGTLCFDTAAGRQRVTRRDLTGEHPQTVWQTSRPRLCETDALLSVGGRAVRVSLVHSGMAYVVVAARDLAISMQDHVALSQAGRAVVAAAREAFALKDYGLQGLVETYLVMVVGDIDRQGARPTVDVAWVSGSGLVANSAGGTGALAVAAHLQSLGALETGEVLVTQAPGGPFECTLLDDHAEVAGYPRLLGIRTLQDGSF
ncbi:Proline racemase [Shimia gijangensis]|uniref:Proline racemase n=1 Tax=Shimia gijangensis TaxID=1470563 RepID=A0A1M6P6F3_9RHOB|nr:proline racemase family protein [Shimia gijangensis]SHK03541.1 Proline racemase [Shimia gijangensis]